MGTESGRPSSSTGPGKAAVLVSSLDKEAIRSIALAARGRADLSRTVGDSPATGSYNVVLSLDFSDGIRWAMRIPMEEDCTDLCAREMRLDVLAQQYYYIAALPSQEPVDHCAAPGLAWALASLSLVTLLAYR